MMLGAFNCGCLRSAWVLRFNFFHPICFCIQDFSSYGTKPSNLWIKSLNVQLPHSPQAFKMPYAKSNQRRAWQPTLVFLTGESHGQRSMVSYGSQACKELDKTEATQQTCMLYVYSCKIVTHSFSFFYLILFFNFTILYWFCHIST